MSILQFIKQIDWQSEENRKISESLIADAAEYFRRVEAHIYQGNEIRADMFMDYSEKQEEISRLDRKRTDAHNKMLTSFSPFLDLLISDSEFKQNEYRISSRTQIADFVALIAFEIMGMEPVSKVEGNIRDELAEKLHKGEVTYVQIRNEINKLIC